MFRKYKTRQKAKNRAKQTNRSKQTNKNIQNKDKQKQTEKGTTDLPTAMLELKDGGSVNDGYNSPANSSLGSLSSSTGEPSSTKTPSAFQSTAQSPVRFDQGQAQSTMVAPSTPESEPYDDDDYGDDYDDDIDPMYGVFIPPACYSPPSLCSSDTDDTDDTDDDDNSDDGDDGIGGTAPPPQHRHRGGAFPAATGGSYDGPVATGYGVGSGNGLGPGYAIRQDRVDELDWEDVGPSG